MLCWVVLLVFAVTFSSARDSYKYRNEQDTLILSHVIFRHGDRTPDVTTIYPTDPYANETYFPFGKGQLTQAGKKRAYDLGSLLRQRYNSFLGQIYYPDVVYARSSSYPRTRMTLELVLAGLFPPVKEFRIKDYLFWQPVPYDYVNSNEDDLIATFVSCPNLIEKVETFEHTPSNVKTLKRYRRLYEYLSTFTGWDVNNTKTLSFIHNTLETESQWGLELPEWTDKIWPNVLKSAASNFWRIIGTTFELQKMSIGNLLKKIVKDSIDKINGSLTPKDRKMFLYSGHDFTIVPLAGIFGHVVTETQYTAHIIIEVHRIDSVHGVKVYFNDYSEKSPMQLQIKGCEMFCPMVKFIELMDKYFNDNNWCY